jgi:hypothetical protein
VLAKPLDRSWHTGGLIMTYMHSKSDFIIGARENYVSYGADEAARALATSWWFESLKHLDRHPDQIRAELDRAYVLATGGLQSS